MYSNNLPKSFAFVFKGLIRLSSWLDRVISKEDDLASVATSIGTNKTWWLGWWKFFKSKA